MNNDSVSSGNFLWYREIGELGGNCCTLWACLLMGACLGSLHCRVLTKLFLALLSGRHSGRGFLCILMTVLAIVSVTLAKFSFSSFTVHSLKTVCIHIWKHSEHAVFHLRALLLFYYFTWEEHKQRICHHFLSRRLLLCSVNEITKRNHIKVHLSIWAFSPPLEKKR